MKLKYSVLFISALFLISYSDFVYADLGDNQNQPGRDCLDLLRSRSSATPSRVYWVDPNTADAVPPFQVYCDMETDGGGWMQVLAYHHPAGDTSLTVNPIEDPSISFPLTNDDNYHVDNLQLWGFAPEHVQEVRLSCSSSGSNRIINYKTNNQVVLNSILNDAVDAKCNDLKSSISTLTEPEHTGNLPLICATEFGLNPDQIFGYNFPMRDKFGVSYNWALDGVDGLATHRWECDDASSSDGQFETYHNVYVRGEQQVLSLSCVLGSPGDNPPPGYSGFYRTALFFEGVNNYNGHIGIWQPDATQEFFCPVNTGGRVYLISDINRVHFMDVSCNPNPPRQNCHAHRESFPPGEDTLYFDKTHGLGDDCYITGAGAACNEGDMCLLKMGAESNSHVASCDYTGSGYDYSICCQVSISPGCGNGIIEQIFREECDCGNPNDPGDWDCSDGDGADLNGKQCDDFGLPGNGLDCDPLSCRYDFSGCGEWIDDSSYFLLSQCECIDSPDNCADGIGEQTKTIYVWDGTQYNPASQEQLACFMQLNEPIPLISEWFVFISLFILISYYFEYRTKFFRNIFK